MYTDDRQRLAAEIASIAEGTGRDIRYNDRTVRVNLLAFRSRAYRVLANVADVAPPHDVDICENRAFSYTLFDALGASPSRGVIFMFHGLNEKFWDKYYPWACELSVLTGKSVVLFPIAFHMNRAPKTWSDPRAMTSVAQERRRRYAPAESSFANAALSSRLQEAPERFLWSGLQTYYDVLQLVDEIRSGSHPTIDPAAGVDFFGYSIGALLAEVLMFETDRNGFSDSRAFLFCGGGTLAEMMPVSRYIMDSAATAAVSDYYKNRFDDELRSDSPVRRLFDRIQDLGTSFRSMLFFERLRDFRAGRFTAIGKRLIALVLKKDRVMPSGSVERTLGRTTILDFPFDYTHEQPFPTKPDIKTAVDAAFKSVMHSAASFLA
jgi:Family of unknown function (DUF6051)